MKKKWVSRIGAAICSMCCACSILTPVHAEENWETAYEHWILQQTPSASASTAIMLRDIDFDGIPELFYGWHAADSSVIESAWSFHGGKMTQLGIQAAQTPFAVSQIQELRLYRNAKNASFSYYGPFTNNHNGVGSDQWQHLVFDGQTISASRTIYQMNWTIQNELHSKQFTNYYFDGKELDSAAFDDRLASFYGDQICVDTATLSSIGRQISYAPNMPTPALSPLIDVQGETTSWNNQAVRDFLDLWTPLIVRGELLTEANQMRIASAGKTESLQTYLLFGNNYVKLRDLAALLKGTAQCYQVRWDGQSVHITTGLPYAEGIASATVANRAIASYSLQPIYIDGKQSGIIAYNINDSNYVRLRDAGVCLGFNVSWDGDKGTVLLS